MKVMDFFGAGVPVCALDYGPCLAEAVRDGDNGLTFTDAPQLARLLVELAGARVGASSIGCAPAPPPRVACSWDKAWAQEVLPVLSTRLEIAPSIPNLRSPIFNASVDPSLTLHPTDFVSCC